MIRRSPLIAGIIILIAGQSQAQAGEDFEDALAAPFPMAKVIPQYPKAALAKHLEDRVEVWVSISPDGQVTDVAIEIGKFEILNRAAEVAVRQWRYKPVAPRDKSCLAEGVDWIGIDFSMRDGAGKVTLLKPSRCTWRWSGEFLDPPPILIHHAEPNYPVEAEKTGKEGRVFVEMELNSRGHIVNACILRSDDAIFNTPTLAAVKHWRYRVRPLKSGSQCRLYKTASLKFTLH